VYIGSKRLADTFFEFITADDSFRMCEFVLVRIRYARNVAPGRQSSYQGC
jgi:hypothetical protein